MRYFQIGACALLVLAIATPTFAQNSQILTIQDAVARARSRNATCDQAFNQKKLKTYTALMTCVTGDLVNDFRAAGYPYMDLVNVEVAERLAIAERLDRKKITLTEGAAEEAELQSRITVEENRRDAARQQAQQETADRAAEQERAARAEIAQERYQAALQQQAVAQADAQRRAALLQLGASLLAPTRVQPPSTQTTCQRVGFQVICDTQ